MRPAVYRPAHEQVVAGGAAELHEPGDASHTRAVHAVVAGDVRPSISQPEADPEAVVPLRVLRPRPGCGAGKRGEQCDHAGRVHAPSLAGVGSRAGEFHARGGEHAGEAKVSSPAVRQTPEAKRHTNPIATASEAR